MAISCLPCEWPAVLEERGPEEDPSILLTGKAHIGETPVQIVAIRVNPSLRWAPDYKETAEGSYDANGLGTALETILEEFEFVASECAELLGERHPSIVELPSGPYKVWVMPAAFGS